MKWLVRLKKIEIAPKVQATEPTKPGFVGFVAPISAGVEKKGANQRPRTTRRLTPIDGAGRKARP